MNKNAGKQEIKKLQKEPGEESAPGQSSGTQKNLAKNYRLFIVAPVEVKSPPRAAKNKRGLGTENGTIAS